MAIPLLRILFTISLLLCAALSIGQNKGISSGSPTAFVQNKGQIIDQTGKPNPEVLYLLNTPGLNVQLRKSGFSYDVYEIQKSNLKSQIPGEHRPSRHDRLSAGSADSATTLSFHRVDLEFLDTSEDLVIEECDASAAFTNYYNVPGREEGITGVISFRRIIYKNLYRGIDVEFFIPSEKTKPVEYNFIVQPGADVSAIKMKVQGAEVNLEDNTLNMQLIHGNLKETIPKSWIITNDKEKEVAVIYTKLKDDTFGFKLANSEKLNSGTLIIDPTPVRQWATYFGGEENESYMVGDVAIDSRGNSVISGYTQSTNILGTGGPPESNYETQAFTFIAKFDPEGNLLWTTYYGGTLGALFRSITIDKDDNIIGVGDASSQENIATPGTHQPALYEGNNENYPDAMIVKFDPNGNRIWGTYFGGESWDALTGVTTDKQGNIFAIGTTASHQNISTPGSFKEIGDADLHHKWNGILARFDKDGNLTWATYYAGEHTSEIAIDHDGNIYFVGDTYSHEEIATPGAHRENFLGTTWNEAFIAKFTPGGDRIWGTYFGGYDYDFGEGLVIDSKNNLIISGATRSVEHIATPGAHKVTKATVTDWDAFLAKFDSEGNLIWSTFYGGDETESFYYSKVDVDINDNIFLFGYTNSINGISTPDGFQTEKSEGSDVFLAKFNPVGERVWGTYYGGNSSDVAVDMDVNAQGEIYLIGWTYSTSGISTPGAHQTAHGGKIDAFLVKFKDCLSGISAEAPAGVCEGEDISFSASGGISYLWSGPNGFSSTTANPVIPAAQASASGTYTVSVSSGTDCDETLEFEVLVSPVPVAYAVDNISACEEEPGTGIASSFDLSGIEAIVLGNQRGLEISVYDEAGNSLPSPLPALYTNSIPGKEKITVKVYSTNNPACYAETTFELLVHPLPQITATGDLYTCDNDQDGISSFDVGHLENEIINNQSGLDVKFFDSSGSELDFSGTYQNTQAGTQNILAKVIDQNSGCSTNFSFDLVVSSAPVANPLNDIIGCDDNGDGISEYFDLNGVTAEVLQGQTGLDVNYYRTDGSEISNFTSPYTNLEPYEEIIKVRLTSPDTGCYAETSLLLKTSAAPQINSPGMIYSCDEGNGTGSFNTSLWTQQITGNHTGLKVTYFDESGNTLPTPLPAVYRNSVAFAETIMVKVENEQNALCVSETEFQLVVNPELELNLDDSYSICGSEPFLELKMTETFDTWEWLSEEGEILSTSSTVVLDEEGAYSLKVGTFENGILCEKVRTFSLVRSVLPYIREIDLRDWSSHNYIKIVAEGDGDFEYSIDGINYFESNYFENLSGGIYTAFVKDKNGCGMATQEVILLDYPRFFSPNYDGYNDRWQLQGFSQQPETSIFIFDRYGKLLKQLSSLSSGWDGTFNGRVMPADDYWFRVNLKDGKEFKGHFSLIQ